MSSLRESPRSPAEILRDWRSLERRIQAVGDESETRRLAHRVEELREEYRAATDEMLETYADPANLEA